MTYVLGLTGSIGMGKSTTAQMFRDLGVPVWDADAAVHGLYAAGGAAVDPVADLVPDSRGPDGIDRAVLKQAIQSDDALLKKIEAVVHPLVARDRQDFIARHADDPLIVLDIPLLFETGGDKTMDGTLVVTTDEETQRSRVLARPGMTERMFENILGRQVSDTEKRQRADFVIRTDTLEATRRDVATLVKRLAGDTDA